MRTMKEAASNMAAAAKSGMEKTKATVQEKVENMTANESAEKEMARESQEEKYDQAEMNKQAARENNAAAKQHHSTTTGLKPMSALPGHGGTGNPNELVEEGTVESHPVGINTGMGGSTAHNPRVGGGNTKTGRGTGGGYS